MGVKHPYYPESIELPGYVPPLLPFTVVLTVFFSAAILLFLASWVLSGNYLMLAWQHILVPWASRACGPAGTQRHLHTVDRVIFCWFAMTGVIHFVVEGESVVCCCALSMWIIC